MLGPCWIPLLPSVGAASRPLSSTDGVYAKCAGARPAAFALPLLDLLAFALRGLAAAHTPEGHHKNWRSSNTHQGHHEIGGTLGTGMQEGHDE